MYILLIDKKIYSYFSPKLLKELALSDEKITRQLDPEAGEFYFCTDQYRIFEESFPNCKIHLFISPIY